MDIEKFLLEKKPIIDSKLLEFLPKEPDEKYVEWAFGKARYAYDIETIKNSLSKPVWDILDRGGKRWRPIMLLLVNEAFGGDPEKVLDFTATVEFSHEGSLLVDDIEDLSELRRGKPCIHKIYGNDIAINAGNFMYFLPALPFIKNRSGFDEKTLLNAYNIFTQEMINIHIGQGLDIFWHSGKKEDVKEEEYLQMCAYKTGTLARMSAKLGAVFANASEEQVEKIGKFAEAVGVGFQIQDDILSVVGDKFQDKKGYGDDITEGKRTLMVLYTLTKVSEDEKNRLLEILGMHTTDKKLIGEALDILKKSGSVEYAKEKAKEIVKSAWLEVNDILEESDAKQKLKAFADFLVEREV
ncbi:MAG: polyprenyl synthetase family protein [Candidatus Aenigmarchaeota archaeon]|nr:polyprenyl synthetase family protein [Candidatus Aenigmarchaeota archaeon]